MECKFCGNIYSTKSNMNRHVKMSSRCIEIQRTIDPTKIVARTWSCNMCEKKFETKENLKYHTDKNVCLKRNTDNPVAVGNENENKDDEHHEKSMGYIVPNKEEINNQADKILSKYNDIIQSKKGCKQTDKKNMSVIDDEFEEKYHPDDVPRYMMSAVDDEFEEKYHPDHVPPHIKAKGNSDVKVMRKETIINEPLHKTLKTETIINEPLHKTLKMETIINEALHKTLKMETIVGEPLHKTSEMETIVREPLHKTSEMETIVREPLHKTLEMETIVREPLHKTLEMETIVGEPLHKTLKTETIVGEPIHKTLKTETNSMNPMDKLNVSNLSEEDITRNKYIRKTPEGKFAVYDVIKAFKGCSDNTSRDVYRRLCKNNGNAKCVSDKYQFLKKDNTKGQAVPVCTFSELLQILSQLPGKEAKILRKEQAEICSLVLQGKEDEIKTIIEARHLDRNSENIQRTDGVNPVDKLNIANLSEENFKVGCRITPDNKISIYDAVKIFKGCSDDDAKQSYKRIFDVMTNLSLPQKHKFKGQGQKPTPVCTFSELLPILSQLPGKEAKILRKEQAEITTRAIAGDRDLIEFVEERERTIQPETKDMLMTGLEQRPYTIEGFNQFYRSLKSDPKYMISMDLSLNTNKDIVYIGIFRPTNEYLQENIHNKDYRNRFFCKFGVSGEVISRSGDHLRDDTFLDYTVIQIFTYNNSYYRRLGEERIKTVLNDLNLRVPYYGKKEVFISSENEFNIIFEKMKRHESMMNDDFLVPFNNNLEMEKMRIEKEAETELEKIRIEKQAEMEKMRIEKQAETELEKMRLDKETKVEMEKIKKDRANEISDKFLELFREGKITFEQLKEIVK